MQGDRLLDEWRDRLDWAERVVAQPVTTVRERGRYLLARVSLPVWRYLVRRYTPADGETRDQPPESEATIVTHEPGGVSAETAAVELAGGRAARSGAAIRSTLDSIHAGVKPLVAPGSKTEILPDDFVAAESIRHYLVAREFKRLLKARGIPARLSFGSSPYVVYVPHRHMDLAAGIYDEYDFALVDRSPPIEVIDIKFAACAGVLLALVAAVVFVDPANRLVRVIEESGFAIAAVVFWGSVSLFLVFASMLGLFIQITRIRGRLSRHRLPGRRVNRKPALPERDPWS